MCFKLFSGLSIPAVVEIVSPMRLFGAAAHIGSGVKWIGAQYSGGYTDGDEVLVQERSQWPVPSPGSADGPGSFLRWTRSRSNHGAAAQSHSLSDSHSIAAVSTACGYMQLVGMLMNGPFLPLCLRAWHAQSIHLLVRGSAGLLYSAAARWWSTSNKSYIFTLLHCV